MNEGSKITMVRLARCGRRFSAIVAALVASALAPPVLANTITFQTAPPPYPGDLFTGAVTEDDFTYSLKSGDLLLETPYASSDYHMAALAISGGGVLQIVAAGGGDFTFDALDFAAEYEKSDGDTGPFSSETLDVTGLLDGSPVGTDAYTLTGSGGVFDFTTELASVLAGKSVSELDIALHGEGVSGPPAYIIWDSVDNVVLTPGAAATVPEPGSLALLGAGLAVLAAILRRRKPVSRIA